MLIREIRDKLHLSQKEFSQHFNIPISTLRKWEQGESTPSNYLIDLIIKSEPSLNDNCQTLSDSKHVYFINKETNMIYDKYGNSVFVKENLKNVNEKNLILYLNDFFNSYYELQNNLNLSIRHDSDDNIEWEVKHV